MGCEPTRPTERPNGFRDLCTGFQAKAVIENPDFIYKKDEEDRRFYYMISEIDFPKYHDLYIRAVVRLDAKKKPCRDSASAG